MIYFMVQSYQSIKHANPGAARETLSESHTNVPLMLLPNKINPVMIYFMVQSYQSIKHANPGAARETLSESYTNVPLMLLPNKINPPTTVDSNLYHFG